MLRVFDEDRALLQGAAEYVKRRAAFEGAPMKLALARGFRICEGRGREGLRAEKLAQQRAAECM